MSLIRSSRGRDLRVDFFRGLALWWIYTDHIPGDVLGDYSLRNFAMCDASVRFVPDNISLTSYRALATTEGGETVTE